VATEPDQRVLRAARNQATYRNVNERIEELNQSLGEILDVGGMWICECADEACTEPMQMTPQAYEQLRAHPNRFAVLRGHVYPEVERVVEEHDGYVVVEKLGAGASFAVAHDPRRIDR
jgi:hypothetical protein